MTTDPLLVPRRHADLVSELLGGAGPDPGGRPDDLVPLALPQGVDVQPVLADLRERARSTYGWVPEIGRDRDLQTPVTGQPQDSASGGTARPSLARGLRRDSADGAGVTVGIVDTRLYAHPWLFGAVVGDPSDLIFAAGSRHGLDADRDGRLDAQAAHATFSAGLVLRQAPAATVLVDHALDGAGHGRTSAVIAAVLRLVARGADVVNLSLGCWTEDAAAPYGLAELVRRVDPRVVLVAAAGNRAAGAPPTAFWPAAFPSVVAVGAVEPDGAHGWRPTDFSNYGRWLDVAAPGRDVESTYVSYRGQYHGWATWSGTSFATAIASGTLAATMSREGVPAREAVARLGSGRPTADFGDTTVPVLELAAWPADRVLDLAGGDGRRPVPARG